MNDGRALEDREQIHPFSCSKIAELADAGKKFGVEDALTSIKHVNGDWIAKCNGSRAPHHEIANASLSCAERRNIYVYALITDYQHGALECHKGFLGTKMWLGFR